MAVGGDVVQDPAQVIFIISKNPYSTKPTVILNFSTPSLFLLMPTVLFVDNNNYYLKLRVMHYEFNRTVIGFNSRDR